MSAVPIRPTTIAAGMRRIGRPIACSAMLEVYVVMPLSAIVFAITPMTSNGPSHPGRRPRSADSMPASIASLVTAVARSAPTTVKTMPGSAPPSAVAAMMCDGFVDRGRYRAMSGLLMYEIGPEAMIVKPIVIADHSGTPESGSGCWKPRSTCGRRNTATVTKITASTTASHEYTRRMSAWPYTATSTVSAEMTRVTTIGTTTGSVSPMPASSPAPRNDDASQLSARNTAPMSQPVKATTGLLPMMP